VQGHVRGHKPDAPCFCCGCADIMSTGGSAGNAPGEAPPQRNPLYSSGEQGANLAAHPLSPSGTATPGGALGSGALSARSSLSPPNPATRNPKTLWNLIAGLVHAVPRHCNSVQRLGMPGCFHGTACTGPRPC
jgi:hypothetical protein